MLGHDLSNFHHEIYQGVLQCSGGGFIDTFTLDIFDIIKS